jgi:prophage antirepressor-like protein
MRTRQMGNDMNDLTTFNFNSNAVRVVTIEDQPWFVAVDAYKALGLVQWGGILDPLDDSEKTMRGRTSVGMAAGRDVWLISESGLYKLVMRSDKPEARAFQDWVTREVLPSIRKNGGYIAGQEKVRSGEMSDLEFLARAQSVAQRVLTQMQEENAKLTARVAQLEVTAEAWETAINPDATVTTSELAAQLGYSDARMLHAEMHRAGFIKPRKNQRGLIMGWLPTEEYAELGFHKTVTTYHEGGANSTTRWTPSGVEFITARFRKRMAA